jgi:recombination protein RecR
MQYFSDNLEKLIDAFADLPGVGRKSASRLAFYLINAPKEKSKNLTEAINKACENVHHCSICNVITDKDICPICSSEKRDKKTIMVVENERDLYAYEKVQKYNGLYHVLGGAISPLLGIGPNQLKIKELIDRLKQDVNEVIIATNSSIEGETTATYLAKIIKTLNIKTTRIAQGVPMGGDIENIDEHTLLKAFEGRIEI